jgi:hypothetical protein
MRPGLPAAALAAVTLLGLAVPGCAAGTPAGTGPRSAATRPTPVAESTSPGHPAANAGQRDPAGTSSTTPGRSVSGPATGTGLADPAGRAAVLTAYRRFWRVAQHLDAHPQPQWAALLGPVAAEPLLSRLLAALRDRLRAGYRQFGDVRPRPVVVQLAADHAAVLDCQDAAAAGEIDTATGLPANTGQPRTPVAAALTRGADGRWRVSDARYLDGTC